MKPCNQCGKCCLKYGGGQLHATDADLDWWETHRPEIFRLVADGKIWVDPDTGKTFEVCPWLMEESGLYSCKIYFDRPEDCRLYPALVEDMIKDDCEMIEVRDLTNLNAAKDQLERILER